MTPTLLAKLFKDRAWSGPCVVVLDAAATVQASGSDTIINHGVKTFAPRHVSGRVAADAACLLAGDGVLLLVSVERIRQATGGDIVKPTLTVVDVGHVAAIEFGDLNMLAALEVPPPEIRASGIPIRG